MKTKAKFALFAAALSLSVQTSNAQDTASSAVIEEVKAELAYAGNSLLPVVTKHITATPQFSCEIVKTVITETSADAATIGTIVEAAAVAAPDQLRLVAQCAIAVAPDSATDVQVVLAKLDPAAGDDVVSGKEVSGKGVAASAPATAAATDDMGNPLDFPSGGEVVQVGPSPNSPGAKGLLPLLLNNVIPNVAGNKVTETPTTRN